ncbi:MAG: hypothetical protein JRI68_06665 [Deltaproteobacteria bacterium]|nr:hypothetical protein [Deltaproteobacteria bacterium]
MKKVAALVVLLASSCCAPPAKSPTARWAYRERSESVVRDGHTSFAALGSQPILLAALKYPRARGARLAPTVSLTTSDGTGLALAAYEARSVVDGPLAFTELRLSFRNPHDTVLEGRFHGRLPRDAALSRLAMRIDDRWQEAEVVERDKARRTYEDFLHRKQDPALLERQVGNEIGLRIFPIPARGTKDIILSYSHSVGPSGRPFRLPLRGLPEVQHLKATVQTRRAGGGFATHRFEEQDHEPARDLLIPLANQPAGLRHGNLVAARITPRLDARIQPLRRIAVLFDTSASRALGFAGEVARLGQLLAELRKLHGDDLHVELATFDHRVNRVYAGPIEGVGRPALDAVLARRPLGASDLHGALDWLSGRRNLDRAVIVTDGVATAGPVEAAALRQTLRRARPTVARLDLVMSGGIRADRAMERLVVGPLAQHGVVLDGSRASALVARRVSQDTRSGVTIRVAGATWWWPDRLDGLQPGDEALVFARLETGALGKGKALDVTLGGSLDDHWSVPLVDTAGPLLQRAAASATIEALADRRAKLDSDAAAQRRALRRRIVELSTHHRVLSDFTALLVLETEQDYERYGIDRNGRSDLLTVGPGGVETLRPTPPAAATARSGKGRRRYTEVLDESPCTTCPKGPPTVGGSSRSTGGEPDAQPPADEGYGYSFSDDPLTAGGFGPGDATIRTRPGPMHRVAEQGLPGAAVARVLSRAMGRTPPYAGTMAQVMDLVETGATEQAVVRALGWRNEEPGDVMALVALGEALEARGNLGLAERAYGSIFDLYPARADLRRFAAGRLERLDSCGAPLVVDAYRKAVADRPDHLSGHRLLAYALLRAGHHLEAFSALETAFRHLHRSRVDGEQVLREDLGLVGAAWARHAPKRREAIVARLASRGCTLATEPSLRFVLTWETDNNDVDLHVFDGRADHADYSSPQLTSGGVLYGDVTNGYGPECFAIHGKARAFPYRLAVHYYSRGPMGYGMGKVEIVEHDGRGRLRFDQRPFVVMNDEAFVDLGMVGEDIAGPTCDDR